MGIGLEGNDAGTVAQHPRGGDAVQIERGDEGHGGAEQRPGALQDEAFGIMLADGAHRAMQGEIDEIDALRGGLAEGRQKLVRKPFEGVAGQRSGAAGEGAVDRHDLDVAPPLQPGERAADEGLGAAPRLQQPGAAMDLEVVIGAEHRIEGRYLLLAFDDQDATQFLIPGPCSPLGRPEPIILEGNPISYTICAFEHASTTGSPGWRTNESICGLLLGQ